ncbi:MAG: potassium-transporting ATPase subunit KdpC [Elusimicrobia bacterium]|nr:potassium-transporting ATPase subunit KdpC [Elusimicrobiota bacterium]
MRILLAQLRPALLMLLALTALTGFVYPALMTGLAQLVFPKEANGSMVAADGHERGSALIGQSFTGQRYFWARPSATGPFPYNAAASSGSNLGPANPALTDAVKGRLEALRKAHGEGSAPVPLDLVTASASGLDPHITPEAARYQVARIARARGLAVEEVLSAVERHTQRRTLGLLGEARVNVLTLNLALDAIPGKLRQ